MANILDREKQQQILALGRLGWTLRRIEQETGIRRETVGRYLKKAGIDVCLPGRWGHPDSKAAIEVITDSAGGDSRPAQGVIPDSEPPARPGRNPSASACEPYRDLIEQAVRVGRNATVIWQDLVDDLSIARCRELGITVVDVEPEVLLNVADLPRRLSRRDRLSFHVCRENDWICVTNDRPLRRICGDHGVRTRWGLELMLELVSLEALSPSRALGTARRIQEYNPHHISEAILERFAARLGHAG